MVADRDGLRALQVRVAGQRGGGLLLGTVEQRPGERLDPLDSLRAGVGHVQPQRGRDLVVPRPSGLDLSPRLAEASLDQGVYVLVARLVLEALQDSLRLGQLVVVEDARRVQAGSMHGRRPAVVREQLGIGDGEEVAHLRRELRADPARPERHAVATSRSRAARSSVSSAAMRMNPSAASCGKVSPVP